MRLVLFTAFALALRAQEDAHAADRQQMLAILRDVEASINSQSLELMTKQMDATGVVVWANGEVSRGPAEVLAYYERMVKGSGRILTKYTTKAKLSGHARFLSNDIAIADGTMEDEYTPVVRGPFQLNGQWTTTLARIDGQWKIVALHLSANVFNNVLIDEAKSALMYTGGGGAVVGALLGFLLGRRRKTTSS